VSRNNTVVINGEAATLESTSKRREIGFTLTPKFGYYFNEKFALGLSLHLGTTFVTDTSRLTIVDAQNNFISESSIKKKETYLTWGAYPFVRYSVFTYKKFFLMLEGRIGVGMNYSFFKREEDKIKNELTTLSISVFNVTPIVGFKLSKHFQMEAGLNFLNLGYNIDITKEEEKIESSYLFNKINRINHNFNIGFNSSSIFSVSQLTIGVIYKF
jgi:hypothetical protein